MSNASFSKVDPRTGRLALDDPFGLDSLDFDGKSRDEQLELLREHIAYRIRIGPNHFGLDLSKSDVRPMDDGQLELLRGLIVEEARIARERQMRRELVAQADAPPPSFAEKLLPDETRIARDRAMQQLIGAQTLIARGRQIERQPDDLAGPANDGDKPPPAPERLALDPSTRTVTLDGRSESIKLERAFLAFRLVAEAKGAIVTSDDIRAAVPGYRKTARIDLALTRHLPKWVRELIPGAQGHNGGFLLEMPKVVRKGAQSVREKTLKR